MCLEPKKSSCCQGRNWWESLINTKHTLRCHEVTVSVRASLSGYKLLTEETCCILLLLFSPFSCQRRHDVTGNKVTVCCGAGVFIECGMFTIHVHMNIISNLHCLSLSVSLSPLPPSLSPSPLSHVAQASLCSSYIFVVLPNPSTSIGILFQLS